MKNKTGKITGFVFGLLLAFLAIALLSRLHPEEDFAGVTIFTLLLSGLLFSFIGSLLQHYIFNKKIRD